MIEEKYQELIQGKIDGANSPKETVALKEYLAKSPEGNELHEDLRRLSGMLSQVEEVEPSQNIKKRVLNSIDPNRYAPAPKRRWIQFPLRIPLTRRQVLVAYAFVAGLFVGIATYALLESRSDSLNISELYGSILRPGSSERLETGETVAINTDVVTGSLKTKYSREIILAQISLDAQREVEVVLEFDENSLSFSGFGAEKTDGNNLNVGKDYFRLTNIGQNRYFVVFSNKLDSEKPIDFKILSGGSLLYQRSISTGPKDG